MDDGEVPRLSYDYFHLKVDSKSRAEVGHEDTLGDPAQGDHCDQGDHGDPAQGGHGYQQAEGSDGYDCLGGAALAFDKNELQFSQNLPVDERCLSNSSIPSENNLRKYKPLR